MEWIMGFWVAVIIGMILGVLIGAAAGDEAAGLWGAVVTGIIVYIGFGLLLEIPEGYFMKVEKGKVVETKIRYIVAWEAAPEYVEYSSDIGSYADMIYFGAIQSPELKHVKYKIYYRVWDDDLNMTQLYYDEAVIIKRGDINSILKEAEFLVMVELVKNPNADTLKLIRKVFKSQLAGYGIKLTAVMFEEE